MREIWWNFLDIVEGLWDLGLIQIALILLGVGVLGLIIRVFFLWISYLISRARHPDLEKVNFIEYLLADFFRDGDITYRQAERRKGKHKND